MGVLDITLALFVLLAVIQRNGPMLRTACALLGCLVLNRLHFLLTHEYVPWGWYLVVDTITAAIVLVRPAGRVQALIGVSYLAEISFHTAYGVFLHRNGYQYGVALSYWELLFSVAILQALLLGGWIASGLVRFIPRRRAVPHRRVSSSPHSARVG